MSRLTFLQFSFHEFFPSHVCLFLSKRSHCLIRFPCVLYIHFELFQSLLSISVKCLSTSNSLHLKILYQTAIERNVLSYLKIQVKRFSLIFIPVTPSQWQGWGEWAQCSTSCGKGTRIRARACNKSDGSCPGEPTDTKYCLVVDCPGCAFCKIPFLSDTSLIIVCLAVSVTDSCC